MSDQVPVISLRKLRDSIEDIHQAVDVSKRDDRGFTQILGRWTPAVLYTEGSVALPPMQPLDLDIGDPVVPAVIKTPEDARAVASTLPAVRPAPKPSQQKKTRSSR